MPIGTARMAAHALGADLVVGVVVEEDPAVRAALEDTTRQAVLLWPENAADLSESVPEGPLRLVVVDGTWALAKKLVRVNPKIAALPRVSFVPARPSEYRIRREPSGECVSTLEAIMYALRAIERGSRSFEELLTPFRFMVDKQIEHQGKVGHGRIKPPPRARRVFRLPTELGEAENVVLVVGEANAWPFKEPRRAQEPDELVHWVAIRPHDGSIFRCVVRPERELCPRTPGLLELSEAEIAAGVSRAEFAARWAEFAKPNDVLVGWGLHPLSLVNEQERVTQRFVDLRLLTKDWAKQRTGTVEVVARALGISSEPITPGRAGRRLGLMSRVLAHLQSQPGFKRQTARKTAISPEAET